MDAAERRLSLLGALSEKNDEKTTQKKQHKLYRITSMGRSLALLPVSPAYGKMLILAEQQSDILPYAVCLVAALSVREPFLPLNIDAGLFDICIFELFVCFIASSTQCISQ